MPHLSRFAAALVFSGLTLAAAPGRAADVRLDSATLATGEKGKISFKTIVLTDCNLTQAEVASLFSGALNREETAALLERLSASHIAIDQANVLNERGDSFVLHGLSADRVARGSADSIALASSDAVLPGDSGDSTLHGGPGHIDKVAIPGLAAAVHTGDLAAAASRFAHLNWDGFEMSVPDKETPAGANGGNRILIHGGPIVMDQTFDADGVPQDTTANVAGLSLKMPPESKGAAMLAAFGYSSIDADLRYAGRYEAASRQYRLLDYSLDAHALGKIGLSGQFSGVDKAAFTGDKAARGAAMQAAAVDWAQVNLVNSGLFEKVVALNSLTHGKPPEAIKAEWRAIVAQAPMLFSGAPGIGVVAQAVDHFIADPKNLTLHVQGKDGALKISDFASIEEPMAFLNRLAITAQADAPPPAKP